MGEIQLFFKVLHMQLHPEDPVVAQKNYIRSHQDTLRRLLTEEEVQTKSEKILSQLVQLPEFQSAKTVLLYYPIEHEVNTKPLVKKYFETKLILFPVSHRKGITVHPYTGKGCLDRGKFGIPEPNTKQYKGSIDIVIVPGLAFSRSCYRLGRGEGYYDRFLKQRSMRKTLKIALGYSDQVLATLPIQKHDQPMDMVITEDEVIRR